MYKKALIMLALLAAMTVAQAQWLTGDSASRWETHLSVGTSVATGLGRTEALQWVAPRLAYRASDRLTLHGGLVAVGSLLGDVRLRGREPRSLAPRQQGTHLMAATLGAELQVSDRLSVWGSVSRVAGTAHPLWLDGAVPVEATAFSGGVAYLSEALGLFELHVHIVHDRFGTAGPGLGAPLGFADWDPCASPWHL